MNKKEAIQAEREKYDRVHKGAKQYGLGRRQVRDLKGRFPFSKKFRSIIKDSKTCLDVGCGGGTVMVYAHELGCRPTGVDISEHAIKKVNLSAKNKAGNRDFFDTACADCSNLPFPNKKFDTVFFLDGLEHVPVESEADCIDECFRVSKKYVAHAIALMSSKWKNDKSVQLHVNLKDTNNWECLVDRHAKAHRFKKIYSQHDKKRGTFYLIYERL